MFDEKNWKHQLKYALRSVDEVASHFKIKSDEILKNVEKEYPLFITPYYLNLINENDLENDPIWKMSMPSELELSDSESSLDPLSEEEQMVVPNLIHRYPDRVVMLTTNRCPMLCRHCFRKRKWKRGERIADITPKQLDTISEYLEKNTNVREILVSGGDPLMLGNKKIKQILDKLSEIKNIEIIRMATRIPVTLPMRIDDELISILREYPQLWFVTHFNHINELTKSSLSACKKITNVGIPVLNQSVLLKGVNDNANTLEELFRALIKNRIKPHYLFHVDPVRGVKHFATGVQAGLDILREFRKKLSSLAVPHFAIDLPDGGGKVSLQPDYSNNGGYTSITGNTIDYY